MTHNISLTRKNKGYSKKEVAAQVKPKQSSTKDMLKNPHDFAPYFPNQQNKNKQSNKKIKTFASRCFQVHTSKICMVDKKYELHLQAHPREESKYECNQHTYNEFI